MNITAGDDVEQKLFRLQLNPDAPVQLEMNLQGNNPENTEGPEKGLGFYAHIESNGSGQMNARLGVHIDAEELGEQFNREINASQLRWAYWNGATWQVVASTIDDEGILECETDHFSTWTILEVEQETPDDSVDDEQGGIPGFPYESVVLGVLLITLLAYIFREK